MERDAFAAAAAAEPPMFQVLPLEDVARVIADRNAPIQQRMKALFNARHHGGPEAVDALATGIHDDSVLLVHEIAYVMGQLGERSAVPILVDLLQDLNRHSMIRHEAAEALAAIGDKTSLPVLEKFLHDPDGPVRETCQLAHRSLTEKTDKGSADGCSTETDSAKVNFYLYNCPETFTTRDPVAKRNQTYKLLSTEQLRKTLLDPTVDLYLRYEALFVLRDRMTADSDAAIIAAMAEDETSALFRHEVAFVLGQIRSEASATALARCLENVEEHPMARHEAALALGSLGTDFSSEVLTRFAKDPEPIVAESCLVGLDNIREEREMEEKFRAIRVE